MSVAAPPIRCRTRPAAAFTPNASPSPATASTWSASCGCRPSPDRRQRSPSPVRSPASRTRSPGRTPNGSPGPASPRSPSTIAASARAAVAGGTRTARASWPTCGRRSSCCGRAARGGSDRIGVVGVCLGGGYAVRAAADDPRVKAVVGIAGAYNSPALVRRADGDRQLPRVARRLPRLVRRSSPRGRARRRGGRDGWRRAVRLLRHQPVRLRALGQPGHPGLAAHADDVRRARRGSAARRDPAAGRARPGRRLLRARTRRRAAPPAPPARRRSSGSTPPQHIDLYDVEPHVTDAASAAAAFLHRHL